MMMVFNIQRRDLLYQFSVILSGFLSCSTELEYDSGLRLIIVDASQAWMEVPTIHLLSSKFEYLHIRILPFLYILNFPE